MLVENANLILSANDDELLAHLYGNENGRIVVCIDKIDEKKINFLEILKKSGS
jgi:hypothetical protein